MNRRFLKNFIFVLFGIFVFSIVPDGWAKNPFKPFLPEKPIENVAPVVSQVDADKKVNSVDVIVPKVEVRIDPPTLVLKGLIWNSAHPQAIIDGQIVRVGDVIKNVQIKSINRDGVEGDFKGVKVYLKP